KKVHATATDSTRFWLYLAASKVTTIEDDEQSWRELDRFDVTGCEYNSISDLKDETGWRLSALDGQYAILNRDLLTNILSWFRRAVPPCFVSNRDKHQASIDEARRRFKPQPYIQFSKVLRRAGYERAANDVLVRLERNRTRYSDFSWLRQISRWCLDGFLRYGHSPFRPVWIVLAWAIASSALFDIAYYNKRIVPAKDNQQGIAIGAGSTTVPATPRVTFNALIYSIDTLIPIVDFNQKKNWIVEPLSPQSDLARPPSSRWYEVLSDLWRD